jgi:hypothetical protein
MTLNRPCARRTLPGSRQSWLVAALIACTSLSACDSVIRPHQENVIGPFAMSGYLDLRADTQWVRVMPIRENLLTTPDPIDAVVTLEKVGGGGTVALRDSAFQFRDNRLDAVGYAHNFWTTERLDPATRYLIRAVRSDGASSTATVDIPPELEFSLLNLEGTADTVAFRLKAEHLLFVELIHGMRNLAGDQASTVAKRQPSARPATGPFPLAVDIDESPPIQVGLVPTGRIELRVAVARADWPYGPQLSDIDATIPGRAPSNVEHGLGFVGGVATWTVPFHTCTELEIRPDGQRTCTMIYDSRSTSIAGRVLRQPCGKPLQNTDIWLTIRFAGGGAARLRWKTGWDGAYRFEGLEPGGELELDLGAGAPVHQIPPLASGQHYTVPDIALSDGC